MSKILNIFVAFALVLSSVSAFAAPAAYFEMEPSFFAQPSLVVDGQSHYSGFFNMSYDLSDAMKSNPTALKYAEMHESAMTQAGIGFGVGVGGALIYALAARDNFNAGAYIAILLAGLIYGGYHYNHGMSYLFQAVNAYNGVGTHPATSQPQTSLLERSRLQQAPSFSVGLLNYQF